MNSKVKSVIQSILLFSVMPVLAFYCATVRETVSTPTLYLMLILAFASYMEAHYSYLMKEKWLSLIERKMNEQPNLFVLTGTWRSLSSDHLITFTNNGLLEVNLPEHSVLEQYHYSVTGKVIEIWGNVPLFESNNDTYKAFHYEINDFRLTLQIYVNDTVHLERVNTDSH